MFPLISVKHLSNCIQNELYYHMQNKKNIEIRRTRQYKTQKGSETNIRE